jgi:hypothetical protein
MSRRCLLPIERGRQIYARFQFNSCVQRILDTPQLITVARHYSYTDSIRAVVIAPQARQKAVDNELCLFTSLGAVRYAFRVVGWTSNGSRAPHVVPAESSSR